METIRRELAFPFTAADEIAIYYGNLFRTVAILIVALHMSAVTMALIGSGSEILPVLKVAALCLAVAIFVWGRARKLLREWVDYRLLAELLRPAPYFLAIGRLFYPRAPDMSPESLEQWRRVVLRYGDIIEAIDCPPIIFSDQYIYSVTHMLRSYIDGQIRWHRAFAHRHEKVHLRLVRWAGLSFAVVLITALVHAATELFHGAETGSSGEIAIYG